MEHIEEHILELYILESTRVDSRREEIASHLDVCIGCAQLAAEIADFYRDARHEVESIRATGTPSEYSLVTSRKGVSRFQEERSLQRPVAHPNPMGKVQYFVYRHPYLTSGGAFTFGAVAVAALTIVLNTGVKDTNPSYVLSNTEQSALEIRNTSHEILWRLPVFDGRNQFDEERDHRITKTIVDDFDGDGKNEVLTTLPIGSESENWYLKMFDSPQNLRFRKEFFYDVSYRDRIYAPRFCPRGILVLREGDRMEQDIFVGANHFGRSPFVLSRMDPSGNENAQFWHFGHVYVMDTIHVGDSGKKMIVLGGINDTADTLKVDSPIEFPVILVIDPEKIIGQKKSVGAIGFDLPVSDAELYYIRLPLSDIEYVRKLEAAVRSLIHRQQENITFWVKSDSGTGELITIFEYIFDRNMIVKEVKSTNITKTVHARLVAEGKIKSKLDKAYLENLKNGVRYWDGTEWRKEVVRVKHPGQMSNAKGNQSN